METNTVKIYYGEGKGKSALSLGRALVCAGEGKSVFVIQFLKGRMSGQLDYLRRLEPDIQVFRFEKNARFFEESTEEEQQEEVINIRNGLNFARKVLKIGECDVLILDEVLGLVDLGILGCDDLIDMIRMVPEGMELILTGIRLPQEIVPFADCITCLDVVKSSGRKSQKTVDTALAE